MSDDGGLTFWEHLDVLRGSLIRMLVAAVAAGVVAFVLKDWLFSVVLAPSRDDFVTYRLLGAEMKMAFAAGVLMASPYILYVLFRFISPALYENERRCSVRLTVAAYAMFIVGLLVNYFVIFPLTVRFLGTYSVSADVDNLLTLSSYVDTLVMMSIVFGVVFEIPVVCWLLARFGLLKAEWMSRYRKHAVVAIVAVAAVVTPTSDAFTLLLVSLPIWLLYEASVVIVRQTRGKR